jgi:hypothetical protein
MASETPSFDWIRPLASPYLKGYRPKIEKSRGLCGYSFRVFPKKSKKQQDVLGFFAGFLLDSAKFPHFTVAPPECILFAFVEPLAGKLYRTQVIESAGTLRWTSTYIGWLTHRPPRFAMFEGQRTALVRHVSMRDWPKAKRGQLARNFYIETLALLVRSGLVRRWLELSEGK